MEKPLLGISRSIGAVVLAVAFGLPLWSVFVRPDVTWIFKSLLVALWVLAAWRPFVGTCVFVVLVPLALGLVVLGGLPSAAVNECLMFAFASGGALGAATRSSDGGPGRLRWPALVFGAAIVTSAFVDLAAIAAVTPARPFLTETLAHVLRDYWGEDRGSWTVLHDALRWTSMLTSAVFVERALRANPSRRPFVAWIWIASAASAIAFTLVRIAEVVARRPEPVIESVLALLQTQRLSVLHPDPNAAGSMLGLLLVAAVTMARGAGASFMWVVPVPMLLVGFVFAQSRAAIGAVILVVTTRWMIDRVRARTFVVAALVLAGVIGVAGTWMVFSRAHVSPVIALELRIQMARVGLRMATAEQYRLFGVGLSDYARTSRRFVTPDMTALNGFAQSGENAHNNFLQVLVELGAPAFAAFLWLVVPPVWVVWTARSPTAAEYRGLALGLSVFLVSAFFGHPLLIVDVATMFFVALALASSFIDGSVSQPDYRRVVAWAGAGFFLVSVWWRLA